MWAGFYQFFSLEYSVKNKNSIQLRQIFFEETPILSKRLLKSGIIVSGMTLVSRVLGLVRDVVIAHLIGAGAVADVFLFANRIPNFLRRLLRKGHFLRLSCRY